MSFIEIQHVTHSYGGGARALDDVSYSIERGEFFALLGSSGCGKSTLLNIIGGFVDPTCGAITVDGQDILNVPANKRNIGTVFQSYALFPHLTVFDNVAYGLRLKTRDKQAIRRRVEECLALVHLEEFAKRRPHQLSGGQQQRVAIARALAPNPEILMLDEPMGNLDAKLRKEMQVELRSIQQRTGITTIMVTHDQEEAMSMADRIGIMRDGKVQQIGSPQQVYGKPANSFVASFWGKRTQPAPPAWPTAALLPPIGKTNPARSRSTSRRKSESSPIATRSSSPYAPSGFWQAAPRQARRMQPPCATWYTWAARRGRRSRSRKGEIELDLDPASPEPLPREGETLYVTWNDADALQLKDVG